MIAPSLRALPGDLLDLGAAVDVENRGETAFDPAPGREVQELARREHEPDRQRPARCGLRQQCQMAGEAIEHGRREGAEGGQNFRDRPMDRKRCDPRRPAEARRVGSILLQESDPVEGPDAAGDPGAQFQQMLGQHPGPLVEVAGGPATGRAGGHRNPQAGSLERLGQQRVGLAQVLACGRWHPAEILRRADVVGRCPRRAQSLTIERRMGVGMANGGFEAAPLQGTQGSSGPPLRRVEGRES